MSNGRADASTVAFQESLRCFNVSTANTSHVSISDKGEKRDRKERKINLYHFFNWQRHPQHLNLRRWKLRRKNLNLKVYQEFVVLYEATYEAFRLGGQGPP